MSDDEPSPLSLDVAVTPAADVVARATDHGSVLVNLKSGFSWELNLVGALVWQHIAEHGSLRRTLEMLQATYHAEHAVLENDLLLLIRDLHRHKLIDVVEARKSI